MRHAWKKIIQGWHSSCACRNHVLQITSGLEEMGNIRLELLLCLFIFWVVIFICLCKGIKVSHAWKKIIQGWHSGDIMFHMTMICCFYAILVVATRFLKINNPPEHNCQLGCDCFTRVIYPNLKRTFHIYKKFIIRKYIMKLYRIIIQH
jgi:hypothetical protein